MILADVPFYYRGSERVLPLQICSIHLSLTHTKFTLIHRIFNFILSFDVEKAVTCLSPGQRHVFIDKLDFSCFHLDFISSTIN